MTALLPGVATAGPPPNTPTPTTAPVIAHVFQSDGVTGLASVEIKYSCGGPILSFGTTDSTGATAAVELPVGTECTLYASYRGTSASQSVTPSVGDDNVYFQTSAVTVTLSDHSGGPLVSGQVGYRSGSTTYWLNPAGPSASTTDSGGSVTGQLFGGTYDFRMQYNHGTEWQNGVTVAGVTLPVSPPLGAAPTTTVDFQTGLLSIVYSNSLSYGQGSPTLGWFTKSGTELLQGSYLFDPKGSGCAPVSIDSPAAGETDTKTIFAAQLFDHTGAPLVGGVARYAPGGSWFAMGTTDATGSVCAVVDGALGNVKVGMTYHQAEEQKTQNVATNSIFSFQTAVGTIQLVDHDGAGLSGGVVDQGGGSWDTGIATTGGDGYAYVELFPGHTYKFRMDYNHLSQTKPGDPTSATLVFQTGELILHYSGDIAGSLGGSWVTFTKPSMELFGGTYNFKFDGYYLPMTVTEGAVNEQSIITAKLTNHLGQALSGGQAKWGGGSWHYMPDTNAGGWTGDAVPGTLGSVHVAMTYQQGTVQITQDQPTASFYAFQTALGTIRLTDHSGNGLAGGVVDQGGGHWDYGIATTNAGGYAYVELFAGGSYKFQMNYNHTSEQQAGVDPTAATLVFQTGAVNYTGSGTAEFSSGSWVTVSPNPMELLPGTYYFKFSDTPGSNGDYTVTAGSLINIP